MNRPMLPRCPAYTVLTTVLLCIAPIFAGLSEAQGQMGRVRSTPVIVDAQARCPLRPSANAPGWCKLTRAGNGVTGLFHLPFKPWGIAYAYTCGRAAGNFYVVVGLPILDGQMPETGFLRHGRSGRGFYMETGRGTQDWKTLPVEYRSVQNLEIKSTCTWHVRAVLGARSVVDRFVPAIPVRSR